LNYDNYTAYFFLLFINTAASASAWKNRQITAKNKTIIFFNPFCINIGIS